MSHLSFQNATGHANAQFSLAFDPQWLKANLSRYLWRRQEPGGEIVQLELVNVWESSKRVTVLYQLEFDDSRRQMYVGFLVPENRLEDEHKAVLKKAKIAPPFGRTVALVPEANLIMLAYPNDRKMRLLSDERLQAWLPHHLHEIADGALDGHEWRVGVAKVDMLRYVPEKRFTSRCQVQIKTTSGLENEISFIAKQLNDGQKARKLYRNLLSLHKAWAGRGASEKVLKPPMRLPRALAVDEENGVVFIEEISGKNLKEILFELDLKQVIPAVGKLLADFHRAQKRVRKKVTVKNEMAEVREAKRIIVNTLPHFKPRLEKIFERFKALSWNGEAAPVLLHGTYRLNHIFMSDGELALLDLDSMRMGHPAYDVANFLSSLYYLEEAHGRISAELRQQISRYFLAGYAEKMPAAVSPAAVLWFLASLLINKQAKKYVTHSHENGREKVERMLALAETALRNCQAAPKDLAFAALWKMLP